MAGKKRLNVLVVDADEASGLELKDFLSQEGFHPTLLTDPIRPCCPTPRKRARRSRMGASSWF